MGKRVDYDLDEWRAPREDEPGKWGGWEWATEGDGIYRTNDRGEGLWELRDGEFKQIEGTSQFSLPRNRSQAIAKLKRLEMTPRPRPVKARA